MAEKTTEKLKTLDSEWFVRLNTASAALFCFTGAWLFLTLPPMVFGGLKFLVYVLVVILALAGIQLSWRAIIPKHELVQSKGLLLCVFYMILMFGLAEAAKSILFEISIAALLGSSAFWSIKERRWFF